MLQTNQPLLVPDQEAPPTTSSPAEMVATVLGFLRRHYAIILTIPLLAVALAAVYVFTTPTSFTAQASLNIDTRQI